MFKTGCHQVSSGHGVVVRIVEGKSRVEALLNTDENAHTCKKNFTKVFFDNFVNCQTHISRNLNPPHLSEEYFVYIKEHFQRGQFGILAHGDTWPILPPNMVQEQIETNTVQTYTYQLKFSSKYIAKITHKIILGSLNCLYMMFRLPPLDL